MDHQLELLLEVNHLVFGLLGSGYFDVGLFLLRHLVICMVRLDER